MDENFVIADLSPRSNLAEIVRTAFDRAMSLDGQLTEEVLSLPGMSGRKYRYLINNIIGAMRNPHYLEVGSHQGSTLCSAIFGNAVSATAIDNWSHHDGPSNIFFGNLAKFKGPDARVSFLERDFREVDYGIIGLHDVYLFDGPHAELDQYDGIVLPQSCLAQEFVLIVDDWNWTQVRAGSFRAINDLELRFELSIEIRTSLDGSDPKVAFHFSDWHNGYLIAVLRKKGLP